MHNWVNSVLRTKQTTSCYLCLRYRCYLCELDVLDCLTMTSDKSPRKLPHIRVLVALEAVFFRNTPFLFTE